MSCSVLNIVLPYPPPTQGVRVYLPTYQYDTAYLDDATVSSLVM